MQVFFSWSGHRSKSVAEVFSAWLQQVIQAAEPWLSSEIEKGARWSSEVSSRLELSKVGIVCLTKENLDERWILFESGALSKTKDAYVCTLLLDVAPTDVEQPLGQFQHTTREKADIKRLVTTINVAVEKCLERSLSAQVLDQVFETNWPRLETALKKISEEAPKEKQIKRTDRDLLQEVLEILRNQERKINALELQQFSDRMHFYDKDGIKIRAKMSTGDSYPSRNPEISEMLKSKVFRDFVVYYLDAKHSLSARDVEDKDASQG